MIIDQWFSPSLSICCSGQAWTSRNWSNAQLSIYPSQMIIVIFMLIIVIIPIIVIIAMIRSSLTGIHPDILRPVVHFLFLASFSHQSRLNQENQPCEMTVHRSLCKMKWSGIRDYECNINGCQTATVAGASSSSKPISVGMPVATTP